MGAIRAGTALGSAAVSSYQLGQSASGASGVAAGMGGMARAAGGAAMQGARSVGGRIAAPFKDGIERGQNAAWRATAGVGAAGSSAEAGASGASSSPSSSAQPAWAKRLRSEQSARAARQTTMQTIKDGDRPAAGANPSLSERDD
ncbi:hypothetical protein FKB34_08970 [Glycocaulis profundi]|nr:hypothetical protein FKB34_08970 [Glycocaulis profundi]